MRVVVARERGVGVSSTATPGQPTPIGRTLDAPPVRHADATPPAGIPAVAVDGEATRGTAPDETSEPRRRAPRRARLYIYSVDAWSVMKVAFMLAVALGVVIVCAVAALWWLLDYSGVIATMARNVDEVVGSGTTTFDLEAVLAFDRVMGITVLIAALEIALVSVLAGLFAVLYNITVGITGGVEATFTDAV